MFASVRWQSSNFKHSTGYSVIYSDQIGIMEQSSTNIHKYFDENFNLIKYLGQSWPAPGVAITAYHWK